MNEQPWGGEVLGINILLWGRDLSVVRVRPCTAVVVKLEKNGSQGGLCLHPQKSSDMFLHVSLHMDHGMVWVGRN